MKKLVAILFLFSFFSALAQDSIPLKQNVQEKAMQAAYSLRGINICTELTSNYWGNLPAGSGISTSAVSLGTDFTLYYDIPLGKNFYLAPGLSLDNVDVHSNAAIYRQPNSNGTGIASTQLIPFDSIFSADYSENKLVTKYLEIPLELHWKSKPVHRNKSFFIAAGVRGGLLIQSYWKYVYSLPTYGTEKIKVYSIPNLNTFRYGVMARVGYGNFALYGFYGLSDLFQSEKGTVAIPFSVGISLTTF
jgi:hypothetical protein